MSKRRINILLGILSLILGVLLYILFRENTYIAKIFQKTNLCVENHKIFQAYESDFLKFYFPDFLWAFSFCCGLQAIHNPTNFGSVVCGSSVFFFGCLWEGMQYFGVISGTGDVWDISMYLFASLISIILNWRKKK